MEADGRLQGPEFACLGLSWGGHKGPQHPWPAQTPTPNCHQAPSEPQLKVLDPYMKVMWAWSTLKRSTVSLSRGCGPRHTMQEMLLHLKKTLNKVIEWWGSIRDYDSYWNQQEGK